MKKIVKKEFLKRQKLNYDKGKRYTAQIKRRRIDAKAIFLTEQAMFFTMELFVLKAIIEVKPSIVLNVGCGCSGLLWDMTRQRLDVQYIGIDLRDLFKFVNHYNATFVQADIRKEWPVFFDSCDFVVFSEVIEHITKKEGIRTLKNIYKTLTNGGTFVLTTPAMNSKLNMKVEFKKYGHLYYWGFQQLVDQCSRIGFKLKESWSGRFLNQRISYRQVEKMFVLNYGETSLPVLFDLKRRFGTLITSSIFQHVIPRTQASHIQLILEKK